MEIILSAIATILLLVYFFFQKKKWVIIVSIALYTVAIILLVSMSTFFSNALDKVYDCATCAEVGHSAISPSGKYELEIIAGHDTGQFNQFRIRKSTLPNREILYSSDDKFYTRHRLYFLWANEDRVWVYSGDLGTFYWSRTDENHWKKSSYYDYESTRPVPLPDFLKKFIRKS